jgi:galactose-1-phosphate uridylyltransferase
MKDEHGNPLPCFACGDLVSDFIRIFETTHDRPFFNAYIDAMINNRRTDGDARKESSLIIHEDDHVMLFVPKAQVSEWELQVMTRSRIPHVLAADTAVRDSLDMAILKTVRTLENLGASLLTGIELSARFDESPSNQHLIYSFIPRLPYAPPTFSEAQMRWITGVYPEDLARACRDILA